MFDLSWFRTTFRTLDFPSVYKGLQTNWDFPNMVRYIETQKCLKQTIRETLDYTGLKGTFEEKIMFSYMVYNEKL